MVVQHLSSRVSVILFSGVGLTLVGVGCMRDIDAGVARAQAGADELSREIEELRVSVAELQVIGHHASVAFADLRGPLGWLAGIRALAKFRGR